ncbi:hypothetical protein LZ686_12085 [Paracoccus sp. NFXS7]|uniref:hypothetical protein n=1 Tax=Paracoccus sp. NFXS7 TaxID=2908653 RepID=UPI0032DFC0AE
MVVLFQIAVGHEDLSGRDEGHGRGQRPRVHRLGQKAPRPRRHCVPRHAARGGPRQDRDGARIHQAADHGQSRQPVHPRHVVIQQRQIEGNIPRLRDRPFRAGDIADLDDLGVDLRAQIQDQGLSDQVMVISQ